MTGLSENIKKHLEVEKKEWKHLIYGMVDLYQSFESLGLKGQRSTEERIEIYELKKFLGKEDDVLDIGGNTGFIDLQIAPFVNSAEVVEINPHLCNIGEEVKKTLKIENVEYNNFGFEKFETDKKFSGIFSYAADEVIDGLSKLTFIDYLDKIDSMLKEGGLLFFESQASDIMEGKWERKKKILKSRYEVLLEKEFRSEYPINAKERCFLILKKQKKPNLIFITLDGMRQDRINLVPNLKKLAENNIYFPTMITAAPYTIGSMYATLSGLYPKNNGVNSYFHAINFNKRLITLAQYLREVGYHTCAHMYCDVIIPEKGYDKIEIYDENVVDIDLEQIKLLNKMKNKKRFFLHLQPAHIHKFSIREVAKKYDDFDEEYFKNYDENVRKYNENLKQVDIYLEKIMGEINKLENTITIIFSDHGTSNGEQIGEKLYGCYLNHYTIRSFCIIILPDKKQVKIPYQIRSVDILPTVLDLLSIEKRQKHDGESLLPMVNGSEKENRISFTETGRINKEKIEESKHNMFCLCNGIEKFTYNTDTKKFSFNKISDE